MLVILSGLPGTGKTTLARELGRQLGAVHVRIDTIEQALQQSTGKPAGEAGYVVGYAIAEDNLRLGRTVIADSVNPLEVTRAAWRAVAARAHVSCIEFEIICSDIAEHRRRVESRDGPAGLRWADVEARRYESWPRTHVVIDTAGRSAANGIGEITAAIQRQMQE